VNKIYEKRTAVTVYFEREELEQLHKFTKARCMHLSPWIRQVTTHVAAKQGMVPRKESG
jgi:hypothetical protein